MTTLQETRILIDYLKVNAEKVVEYSQTFNHPTKFTFVMIGQYDPTDVIISCASQQDHLTRTNIMLGSGHLTVKDIQETIDHEERDLPLLALSERY